MVSGCLWLTRLRFAISSPLFHTAETSLQPLTRNGDLVNPAINRREVHPPTKAGADVSSLAHAR